MSYTVNVSHSMYYDLLFSVSPRGAVITMRHIFTEGSMQIGLTPDDMAVLIGMWQKRDEKASDGEPSA